MSSQIKHHSGERNNKKERTLKCWVGLGKEEEGSCGEDYSTDLL